MDVLLVIVVSQFQLAAMSLFSVQARKHTAYYDHLMSTSAAKTPGRDWSSGRKAADSTLGKTEITSGESACEDSRRSCDKGKQVNRTYVVSALSRSGSGQHTPYRGHRLTLQRRSRRKTGADTTEKTMVESSQNTTPAPEKRLTLQRRTRTFSMDKGSQVQRGVSVAGTHPPPKILSEPNGRTPSLIRSTSLREAASKIKGRETASHLESQGRLAHCKTPSSSSASSTGRQLLHVEDKTQTFKTPTKKTPFERIAAKRDVFERLAGKETPKSVAAKSTSLERSKSRVQQLAVDNKPTPAPRVSKASAGVHRPNAGLQGRKTSTALSTNLKHPKGDTTRSSTAAPDPSEQSMSRTSETLRQHDTFKMENSAVTVAVRVRPFNARFVLY